ncbi:MAG: spore germination protein GerW family protein [Lachnospiraceae bacterium]|nr:spore germination protein GerW family protein [Lachnospiraceae bacterium]
MANQNNEFKNTVETLFSGMESFLTSKTVVGEPVTVGNTIILPLVNVSFGVAAGAFEKEKSNNGGGGLGGKMTPNAVIVIQDGNPRMIRVDEEDGVNKLLDMVPGIVSKFADLGMKKAKESKSSKDLGEE